MKKQLFATLLFVTLISPVQGQVRKCTGLDGKITYSDFACVSSASTETRIKNNVNSIDASGYRHEVQRGKTARAVDEAMQQGASKCEFESYKNGDPKGQELAAAAEQECLNNLAAKVRGQTTSLEAYWFWKDHHQIKSTQRSASRVNSMNCMPNGFGGLRCN